MSKKASTLCLISLFVLNACTKFFNYEFRVSNDTQEEIKIEYLDGDGQSSVSTRLGPKESTTLFVSEGYRCNPSNCEGDRNINSDSTLAPFITEVKVFLFDSLETKTNFSKEYNWEFESKKRKGIYTAKITANDF